MIKVELSEVRGVTILRFTGRVTLGDGVIMLRDTVRHCLVTGRKKLLLNLGGVSYIDGSGIGELVSALTSATDVQGSLKLIHLTKRVKDMLQLTRLYTNFEVFTEDEEDEAVQSLQ